MEWVIGKTLGALLVPPGILIVVLLAALALTWRRPPLARALVMFAVVALYALSTQFVSVSLLQLLQPEPRDPAADRTGQAIVVLGGGTYATAPEYGGDTVNALTLTRIRYAAHLYRVLKKPVLASGGSYKASPIPEARLMRQALQTEFQIPVQWVEEASTTTLENARGSSRLLGESGVRRIYLVTHAWHMTRARYVFEQAGFTVIPAPTAYAVHSPDPLQDFLPSAQALVYSGWFFHEVIGLGWYHLRIAFGR